MAERPTPPQRSRLHARERARLAVLREGKAVDLRLMGLTYEQIASSLLPCSEHKPEGDARCPRCEPLYADKTGARRAVLRALDDAYSAGAEAREQLRQHHLGQIDLLLRRAMRAAVGADWEALRSCVRLLDQRAKVLGVYAPTRHTLTSELDEEIAALIEQMEAGPGQPTHDVSRETSEPVTE